MNLLNLKEKPLQKVTVSLVLVISLLFSIDVFYLKDTRFAAYYIIAYNIVIAIYLFGKKVLNIK